MKEPNPEHENLSKLGEEGTNPIRNLQIANIDDFLIFHAKAADGGVPCSADTIIPIPPRALKSTSTRHHLGFRASIKSSNRRFVKCS